MLCQNIQMRFTFRVLAKNNTDVTDSGMVNNNTDFLKRTYLSIVTQKLQHIDTTEYKYKLKNLRYF